MPNWLTMPLLHAGQPEPTGWLHSNWRPEPSVVIGVLALIGLYVIWTGSKNRDERGRQIHPVSASQRFLFIAGALPGGAAADRGHAVLACLEVAEPRSCPTRHVHADPARGQLSDRQPDQRHLAHAVRLRCDAGEPAAAHRGAPLVHGGGLLPLVAGHEPIARVARPAAA